MTGLGGMLREAREARGLSLEQVERDTRIVRRYLTALEEEDFEVFPADVYARGFLRSYASYLGLNPTELLALFPIEPPPEHGRAARGGLALGEDLPARRGFLLARRPPLPQGSILRPAATVLAVLLAAFAIGQLAGGEEDPAALGLDQARAAGGRSGAASSQAQPGGPGVTARMPDLRGADTRDALDRLAALGITAFVIEVPSREAPAGQVLRQSPGPNVRIGNATVTLIVSRSG